jgi:surface protein
MEMARMFSDCSSLKSIPNISVWDFSSVYDKNNMFSGCQHDFLKEKIFTDDYNDDDKFIRELNINFDKSEIIKNEDLKFFPQVEIKFNNVNNITKEMTENIRVEIRKLLNEDNFSIIEIKKGSLIIILSLQFIIFNGMKKQKKLNLEFNFEEFANNLSDNVKEEVLKISSVLKNHEFISLGTVKPDYVDEDIIDITDENNRD